MMRYNPAHTLPFGTTLTLIGVTSVWEPSSETIIPDNNRYIIHAFSATEQPLCTEFCELYSVYLVANVQFVPENNIKYTLYVVFCQDIFWKNQYIVFVVRDTGLEPVTPRL